MSFRLVVTAMGSRADAGAQAEHPFDLDRQVVLVGRRPGVDVFLPHADVGGVHLRVERDEGGAIAAVDSGTRAGTMLRGHKLPPGERVPLQDGDELVVANVFRLRYQAQSPPHASPTTDRRTQDLARALVRDLLLALGRDAPDAVASLEVISGPRAGTRLLLEQPGAEVLVGRAESCHLAIMDSGLSREHVRIRLGWSGAVLIDLGSKNGTRVNGARVTAGAETLLRDGNRIQLGDSVLVFRDPAQAYLTTAGGDDRARARRAGVLRLSVATGVAGALLVAALVTLSLLLLMGIR